MLIVCLLVLSQISDVCLRRRRPQHASRYGARKGSWRGRHHIQDHHGKRGGQFCHWQPKRLDLLLLIFLLFFLAVLSFSFHFLTIFYSSAYWEWWIWRWVFRSFRRTGNKRGQIISIWLSLICGLLTWQTAVWKVQTLKHKSKYVNNKCQMVNILCRK